MIDRIAVPTLVLHALDDPLSAHTDSRDAVLANPRITYIETARGGHCAFLADADPAKGDDGYWAEKTLLRFLLEHA